MTITLNVPLPHIYVTHYDKIKYIKQTNLKLSANCRRLHFRDRMKDAFTGSVVRSETHNMMEGAQIHEILKNKI